MQPTRVFPQPAAIFFFCLMTLQLSLHSSIRAQFGTLDLVSGESLDGHIVTVENDSLTFVHVRKAPVGYRHTIQQTLRFHRTETEAFRLDTKPSSGFGIVTGLGLGLLVGGGGAIVMGNAKDIGIGGAVLLAGFVIVAPIGGLLYGLISDVSARSGRMTFRTNQLRDYRALRRFAASIDSAQPIAPTVAQIYQLALKHLTPVRVTLKNDSTLAAYLIDVHSRGILVMDDMYVWNDGEVERSIPFDQLRCIMDLRHPADRIPDWEPVSEIHDLLYIDCWDPVTDSPARLATYALSFRFPDVACLEDSPACE